MLFQLSKGFKGIKREIHGEEKGMQAGSSGVTKDVQVPLFAYRSADAPPHHFETAFSFMHISHLASWMVVSRTSICFIASLQTESKRSHKMLLDIFRPC